MKELARREIAKILIEGGGQVIGSALKEKLVDKVLVFIAPKIMGDQRAVSSIDGLKTGQIKQVVNLHKLTYRNMGDDLLLEAYIK